MDLHAAFLADILENPGDDAPRLVYADWLEEKGDADRAEFVRVQCGLEHGELSNPHAYGLHRRQALLLACRFDEWVAPLTEALGWPLTKGGRCAFRRGFVAEVSLPCAEFLRCAGALFSLAPFERVRLTDKSPYQMPGGGAFGWRKDWPSGGSATLPARLWGLLPPPWARKGVDWKDYPTLPDALDALSAACVSLGRELAGLPSLPAPDSVRRTH